MTLIIKFSMSPIFDYFQNFTIPGIVYKLVTNNKNKTDDLKITKSENEKQFQTFITNTYSKETKLLIEKCIQVENESNNTSTINVRGKAKNRITVDLVNVQRNNSINIENVNETILQETTANIAQEILNNIKTFINTKSAKDFNYKEDTTKKESFLSAILSVCQDILLKEQKIGQYLNDNPEKNKKLDAIFQSTTTNISKTISQRISSKLFKSTFKNIYNVNIELESREGSIDVFVDNSQVTESVIQTLEYLDFIGKVFENISNISGIEVDDQLKETNSIKSRENRKKNISHERVTDIFSNLFGIFAMSFVVLVGAFIFTFSPSSSTSSIMNGFSNKKNKKIKFSTPLVTQIRTINKDDDDLITSGGYKPIENDHDENDENHFVSIDEAPSISNDTLITDVLFNESKFE